MVDNIEHQCSQCPVSFHGAFGASALVDHHQLVHGPLAKRTKAEQCETWGLTPEEWDALCIPSADA